MAVTLPRPVQLRLEQTLSQWQHWQTGRTLHGPPSAVEILGDGHSNFSVLVAAEERFVVRIDGVDPLAHGLNRPGEWRALQTAHRAGLAPRPCYFNPELGSLVCQYLESDREAAQPPAAVARLLRGIHALPARHRRLDLRERILRYENDLARSPRPGADALQEFSDGVAVCLERRHRSATRPVLCHNDLLRANRLASGGQLWAIDWEYAAMGDPLYDLAVVICGDDMATGEADTLVEAYLERVPGEEERCALRDYRAIYRYLELLWYLVQGHPAFDQGRRALALQRLANSLQEARD
jgi:thiamine kinase-like enzyme